MSKKPNLFILGAPKCGTTTIYHWLGQIQDIFISNVKEPHYFCEDYQITSLKAYKDLYKNSDSYKYALDASVWYFYHKSWRDIIKHNPNSKFILLLRNPLLMMQSMHSQQIFNGNELEPQFNEAIKLNDLRNKGQSIKIKKGYLSQHLAYINSCCLDNTLEKFIHEVPHENRLILTLDQLESEENTWNIICDFLKIDNVKIKFRISNRRRIRRFIWLDTFVLFLVSLKKIIGFNKRLGILTKVRGFNTKTINSEYNKKLDIDSNVTLRINKCVKNYETLLKIKLDSWYV